MRKTPIGVTAGERTAGYLQNENNGLLKFLRRASAQLCRLRQKLRIFLILAMAPCGVCATAQTIEEKAQVCAACHGADLAGKPAAKIPSLVADDAKKASDADLTDMIANGGKDKKASHAFASKGLTADQTKMVVAYIRGEQKK